MTQLVKNPPAMRKTWVQSLGLEDPLEEEMTTHFSTLAWRIPWATVHGVARSQTQLSDSHTHTHKAAVTEYSKPGGLKQQSPTFLAPGTGFMEDNFSIEQGLGDGFRMIQVHHILLLLHQPHLRSSGIMFRRLGTSGLEHRIVSFSQF